MTAVPDPAELAPSRDPAAYAKRPLLTGGFWVMMVFCALCLLAAVAVVTLVPRLAPAKSAVAAVAPTAAPLPAVAPASAPVPLASAPASPGDAALDARVRKLEGDQARIGAAAAGALAAAALSDAAARPAPFAADWAAVARLAPGSPDVMALASLAQQGAPTRAALAAELADLGAQASTAARAPGKDASFMDRAFYAFSRVVTVRRVDLQATGTDAILARGERAAEDGDLEGAIAVLDTLPAPAKTALAAWRDKAERRIEIDRHIAGLRAQAVADLAAARGAPS